MGNTSAQMSHFRRTKIVSSLNKTLLPLLEEGKNFKGAPPSPFGMEFAQKSQDLIDQVKAMRSSMKDTKAPYSVFRSVSPTAGGGYNQRQGRSRAPKEELIQVNEWLSCWPIPSGIKTHQGHIPLQNSTPSLHKYMGCSNCSELYRVAWGQ